MNFTVVWTIFFFAQCLYIINGGPTYFNLETLEVSHRSDPFVPGEDYTGLLFLDPGTLVSHHSGSDPFVPDEEYTGLLFRDPGNFAPSNYSRMRKVKPGDIFIVRTDRFYNDTAKQYIGRFKDVADGQVHGGLFMYSMNTGINLTYWMENWNIKVGSFSYYNEKWSWTSKSTNRGDGFENFKIQSVELRRAIMNTIHQFWDTNGTKTVWKVGDPDYKVENLDLENLVLTQPYM